MEKFKNVLVILIILAIGIILYEMFVANSNLKKAISKLDSTEEKLKKASDQIDYSKGQVDSLQQNFTRFSAYIKDIQGRLERLDLEKRINEQVFKNKRDSIIVRLKELNKTVDLTGDALPEVTVIDSKDEK